MKKNINKLLRKIAEDATVYGFAPGTISHNTGYISDPYSVTDHTVFTYKPTEKPDKEYTYTKSNMPFYANAVKHRNELNSMVNSGILDTDAMATLLTDNPDYAAMRRKHYAGISDKDWNKVFKSMDPSQRANMDNIKAPIHLWSDRADKYGGGFYHDPLLGIGSVHINRDTMRHLSTEKERTLRANGYEFIEDPNNKGKRVWRRVNKDEKNIEKAKKLKEYFNDYWFLTRNNKTNTHRNDSNMYGLGEQTHA